MSDQSKLREWPLVFFTVAVQFACGAALVTTMCRQAAILRPLGIAVFPTVVFGMLASLLHLGRPFSAWRSLSNLRQSQLSREVLVMAVFAVVSLLYSAAWVLGWMEWISALGMLTSAVGLAAVFASATIYAVCSQPIWNSPWVPLSFLGATVLLGAASAMIVIQRAGERAPQLLLAMILCGCLLMIVSTLWMLVRLERLCSSGAVPVAQDVPPFRWFLRMRLSIVIALFCAGIVPVALAVGAWFPAGAALLAPYSSVVLILIVTGTLFSRSLLYGVHSVQPKF